MRLRQAIRISQSFARGEREFSAVVNRAAFRLLKSWSPLAEQMLAQAGESQRRKSIHWDVGPVTATMFRQWLAVSRKIVMDGWIEDRLANPVASRDNAANTGKDDFHGTKPSLS